MHSHESVSFSPTRRHLGGPRWTVASRTWEVQPSTCRATMDKRRGMQGSEPSTSEEKTCGGQYSILNPVCAEGNVVTSVQWVTFHRIERGAH